MSKFLVKSINVPTYEEALKLERTYNALPDISVFWGFPEDGTYTIKVYEEMESEWDRVGY